MQISYNVYALTDTAFISASLLVICLKYCSGVMAIKSLYTIFLKFSKLQISSLLFATYKCNSIQNLIEESHEIIEQF